MFHPVCLSVCLYFLSSLQHSNETLWDYDNHIVRNLSLGKNVEVTTDEHQHAGLL